jgi:hypothetical protein
LIHFRRASPIVPGIDRDVYLLLDDFGRMGCAWREANVQDTELEAVIDDLLEGQCSNPVLVISLNVSEGWDRDVSEVIAQKLRQHCADENRELQYKRQRREIVPYQLSHVKRRDRSPTLNFDSESKRRAPYQRPPFRRGLY